MAAGWDTHDVHSLLHLVAHWPLLHEQTQRYAAHRLRLLYFAFTKGWHVACGAITANKGPANSWTSAQKFGQDSSRLDPERSQLRPSPRAGQHLTCLGRSEAVSGNNGQPDRWREYIPCPLQGQQNLPDMAPATLTLSGIGWVAAVNQYYAALQQIMHRNYHFKYYYLKFMYYYY